MAPVHGDLRGSADDVAACSRITPTEKPNRLEVLVRAFSERTSNGDISETIRARNLIFAGGMHANSPRLYAEDGVSSFIISEVIAVFVILTLNGRRFINIQDRKLCFGPLIPQKGLNRFPEFD